MIHKAEEILEKKWPYNKKNLSNFKSVMDGTYEGVIKAINEARIEAIKECMSLIKVEQVDPENEWVGQYGEYFKINREEIESLIKHIK